MRKKAQFPVGKALGAQRLNGNQANDMITENIPKSNPPGENPSCGRTHMTILLNPPGTENGSRPDNMSIGRTAEPTPLPASIISIVDILPKVNRPM